MPQRIKSNESYCKRQETIEQNYM